MIDCAPVFMPQRPSISELFKTYHFKSDIMAILAQVPERTIQDMLAYRPVERVDAEKVLEEISILLRKECTLGNVYVPLREEQL
jgi:hypothetical protein